MNLNTFVYILFWPDSSMDENHEPTVGTKVHLHIIHVLKTQKISHLKEIDTDETIMHKLMIYNIMLRHLFDA